MVALSELIERRGLKKSWIAKQMGITPSTLSRLLSGDYAWDEEKKRLFALAVGWDLEEISFAPMSTQDAELDYTQIIAPPSLAPAPSSASQSAPAETLAIPAEERNHNAPA